MIISIRSELDRILKNKDLTILVLTDGKKTRAVYNFLEDHSSNFDPWHKWLLISNINILKPNEKYEWFDNNASEYYVVLGKNRNVAKKGKVDNLLRYDGKPDMLKIREAILSGDIS